MAERVLNGRLAWEKVMRIRHLTGGSKGETLEPGFTIVEAAIGMGVVGMTAIALFSGLSTGFLSMQIARENLRATQILMEKTEMIRLYSWDQVITPGFIPSSFVDYYDPQSGSTNELGLTFIGSIDITNVPFASDYSANMRQLTVTVTWHNDTVPRTRSYTTFVSQNGLQTYIY